MKIISPDDYLFVNGEFVWNPKRAAQAWAKVWQSLGSTLSKERGRLLVVSGPPGAGKTTLLAGRDGHWEWKQWAQSEYTLAVDGLFLTRHDRSPLVNLAVGAGWTVDAVYMNPGLDECLRRNLMRAAKRVPEEVLRKKVTRAKRPSLDEGFRRVLDK